MCAAYVRETRGQDDESASLRSAVLLRRCGVEVGLVHLAWPVAGGLDRVGLDQFGTHAVVVIAVELVLVAPGVGEIERPAHVEVDEIGEHETLAARVVEAA